MPAEWFEAAHDDTKTYTIATITDSSDSTDIVPVSAYFTDLATAEVILLSTANPNSVDSVVYDQAAGTFTLTGTFADGIETVRFG